MAIERLSLEMVNVTYVQVIKELLAMARSARLHHVAIETRSIKMERAPNAVITITYQVIKGDALQGNVELEA